MSIMYYFITDLFHNREASVEFCPTLDMVGDFFKYFQGSLFQCFCRTFLGILEDDITFLNARSRLLLKGKRIKAQQ